jgi:NAD-dependent SIR2 family protein deacetylase
VRTRDLFHYSALSHPSDGPALIRLCTELFEYAQNSQPTETHHFLKDLSRSGRLVQAYTQNIDHLEEKAGLSTDLSKGIGAWVSSDLAHSAGVPPLGRLSQGVECVQLHGDPQPTQMFKLQAEVQ